MTLTLADDVQPFDKDTVTEYNPGFVTSMEEVLALVFHKQFPVPLTDKLVLCPSQMWVLPEMTACSIMETVWEAVLTHPYVLVTETEYTPGVFILTLCDVAPVDHIQLAPCVTVSEVPISLQMIVLPVIVTGVGWFCTTVTEAEAEHPLEAVAITV